MALYAYVAVGGDNALTIIDVTNPAAPTFKGGIRGAGAPNWLKQAWDVYVLGNYAYVAAHNNNALTIIDVSNPALPTLAGSIQGAGFPNWLGGPQGVWVGVSAAPPASVQTDPATLIGVNTARLHGQILDLGPTLSLDVNFEYGVALGGPYPFSTPIETKIVAGAFQADIAGLIAGTTYYFRAVGDDGALTLYCMVKSLTLAQRSVWTLASSMALCRAGLIRYLHLPKRWLLSEPSKPILQDSSPRRRITSGQQVMMGLWYMALSLASLPWPHLHRHRHKKGAIIHTVGPNSKKE